MEPPLPPPDSNNLPSLKLSKNTETRHAGRRGLGAKDEEHEELSHHLQTKRPSLVTTKARKNAKPKEQDVDEQDEDEIMSPGLAEYMELKAEQTQRAQADYIQVVVREIDKPNKKSSVLLDELMPASTTLNSLKLIIQVPNNDGVIGWIGWSVVFS